MARKPVAKDPTATPAKPEVTSQVTAPAADNTTPKSVEKIGSLVRVTF